MEDLKSARSRNVDHQVTSSRDQALTRSKLVAVLIQLAFRVESFLDVADAMDDTLVNLVGLFEDPVDILVDFTVLSTTVSVALTVMCHAQ